MPPIVGFSGCASNSGSSAACTRTLHMFHTCVVMCVCMSEGGRQYVAFDVFWLCFGATTCSTRVAMLECYARVTHLTPSCSWSHHHCVQVDGSPTMVPVAGGGCRPFLTSIWPALFLSSSSTLSLTSLLPMDACIHNVYAVHHGLTN